VGGVDRKIANAGFFLEEIARSFERPDGRAAARAMAAGVNVEVPLQWERSFHARLDAFFVTAHSVPEVINCCFGKDTATREMTNWFAALPAAEQTRRSDFLIEFESDYDNFRNLPLSRERHISFHRTGYPAAEGKITGCYGVYIGNPIKGLPSTETEPIITRDTAALQWAATQPPPSIRVTGNDFAIGEKPLFAECRTYLEQAERHCQLNCVSKTSPTPEARSRGRDGILLLAGLFSSEDPERRARDEMALKVEGVVNCGMHAEKTLGGTS
jgi:hypothetical protein